MDRIILKFLLILSLSGLILCTVEEQNVIISNKSEDFSTVDAKKLTSLEDVAMGAEEVSENNKRIAGNSSINGKNHVNGSSLDNEEKDGSTKTDEINIDGISKLNTSDIDYGGYNTQNVSKHFEKSNESQKEVYKPSNESIPLPEESVNTTSQIKRAATNVSDEENNTSNVANNTLEASNFTTGNSSSMDLEMSAKNPVNSNISIFSTLDADASASTVESTSIHTVVNTQKQVSASPKSATIKRSLTNTNSASSSADFISTRAFTDYVSDSESSPSSELYDISTTSKYKYDSEEIEELPTPLPLESLQSTQEHSTDSSPTQFAVEQTTPNKELDNDFKVISVHQAISPQTFSLIKSNTEPTKHFDEPENLTESQFSTSVETSKEDLEREHLSSFVLAKESYLPEKKRPLISKNIILPHENDDIIYAGFADDEAVGVTFDPNGVTNNLPQDPDSIIFSVTPIHSGNKLNEKLTDSNLTESETEYNKSLNRELLPHDGPESEIHILDKENISQLTNKDSLVSSESESLVQPEVVFVNTVPNAKESEEMLQDSPSVDNTDTNPNQNMATSNLNAKTTPKEDHEVPDAKKDPTQKITNKQTIIEFMTPLPESSTTESFNPSSPHLSEQSVIRPVKILSRTFGTVPTFFNSTFVPQSNEFSTVSNSLGALTNMTSTTLDSKQTSSPTLLSNQLINATESQGASTVAIEPELVGILSLRNMTEDKSTEIAETNPNSTIAGVAIKTSVSVSLPLSKQANNTIQDQNSTSNSSVVLQENAYLSTVTSEAVSINDTTSLLETSIDTSTSAPSTTTAGVKIRRPGIRIPGASNGDTARTRKPFISALTKPATTVGPPVSIFKKERTRANSITSSTTRRPFPKFSTIRIDYASNLPPGILPDGLYVSVEPTVPPTTTTEEPISEVPFTDQTYVPSLANEDDVTLIKVGGGIVLDKGFKWMDQLRNRHSPEYKEKANQMHLHLERLFRSSPIASRLWRIEIDGFNGTRNSRSVEVDFILYLIKSPDRIAPEHLATVFHERLTPNNTFATYRVDTSRTAFELLQEEPLNKPTPASNENQYEPPVPQWAIAVIVICAASLIFIVLFAAVTMYGRHHMRRRYGNKLNEDDLDRSSGEWESKMTAAYENMAADTIYDAEDLRADAYKKPSRIATFHGVPSTLKRCDSWSSGGWSTPPRRKKPTHVH